MEFLGETLQNNQTFQRSPNRIDVDGTDSSFVLTTEADADGAATAGHQETALATATTTTTTTLAPLNTAEEYPWMSPVPAGADLGLRLRDLVTSMGPWAGPVFGGLCALVLLLTLYSLWIYRRRRRTKVRRHISMLQASDASLHTAVGGPGSATWFVGTGQFAYDVPLPSPVRLSSPSLSLAHQPSQALPQLISTRPRQSSIEGAHAGSGITLKAEVLDPSYYSGTIKKKTRMNGDLAQAIAAFGLPGGRFSVQDTLRRVSSPGRAEDDLQPLPSNMEVVYQERTAV